MSRRNLERRKYRKALVPGLIVSAAVHALILGVGAFDVPVTEDSDRDAEERTERWGDNSIRVVSVQPRTSRTVAERAVASAPARATADAVAVAAPAVHVPSAGPSVSTERVRSAAAVTSALDAGRQDRERMSATELAGMFPGDDQMPRPASRAREVSGAHRDVGDRFRALGGSRRAGPRGGGCIVAPGTIVDRRFPRGITIGGS